ncbi:DUF3515 family protein [Plantactinospora sp. KBS50]|uniref:DUF3515 family protein n=1 Tax=Plantactinospora sp. KBS50 TaxID=2024580 RepID=UPI000BAAEA7A|nr:DUF3515 family protein [Plantactinospora sp. KBS50]ASW53978.1 hypothetical protein CIK06_06965 [Plantactinospora sp. KBS50]
MRRNAVNEAEAGAGSEAEAGAAPDAEAGAGTPTTSEAGTGTRAGSRTGPDRTSRLAALWATVVAVPVTLAVGAAVLSALPRDTAAPSPSAPASESASASPRPQSSAPVQMAAPALDPYPTTRCRLLTSSLPAQLRDLARRPVTAGSEQNAAYGDPALTIGCGVPPATVPPTEQVWNVNGVCWYPVEQTDAAATLTTVDREVPVRVTVPQTYGPALQWLSSISSAVRDAISPRSGSVPSGCSG